MTNRLILVLCAAVGISGCSAMHQREPETIPVHEVINQVKADLSGLYRGQMIFTDSAQTTSICRPTSTSRIVMKLSGVQLALKVVSAREESPNVGLASPIGVLKIDPTFAGVYSRASAQTLSLKMDPPVNTNDINVRRAADVCSSQAQLCAVVVATALDILKTDHSKEPCLVPKELKVSLNFDVVEKKVAGANLQLVVFKLGDKITTTDEFHQALDVTFNLEGSTAAFQ